jgi:DNA-binding XRE family transcriptional regulator
VYEGEAMMFKRSSPAYPKPYNGHRRAAPVEALSARIRRLRIARGYSVYELATTACIFAGTIQRLESGKPADKRVLPALAIALGVPVCQLVCGNHSCTERACVPARRHAIRNNGDADRPPDFRR